MCMQGNQCSCFGADPGINHSRVISGRAYYGKFIYLLFILCKKRGYVVLQNRNKEK